MKTLSHVHQAAFYFIKTSITIGTTNKKQARCVYVLWSARERSSPATRRSLSFVVFNGSIATLNCTNTRDISLHVLKEHNKKAGGQVAAKTVRTEPKVERAWGRGLSPPLPSPLLPLSTNDHWSVDKNSKVELKISDVEFAIWRGKWQNASS